MSTDCWKMHLAGLQALIYLTNHKLFVTILTGQFCTRVGRRVFTNEWLGDENR